MAVEIQRDGVVPYGVDEEDNDLLYDLTAMHMAMVHFHEGDVVESFLVTKDLLDDPAFSVEMLRESRSTPQSNPAL